MTSDKKILDFELIHASSLCFQSSSSVTFSNSSNLEIIICQADQMFSHAFIGLLRLILLSHWAIKLVSSQEKTLLVPGSGTQVFSCPGCSITYRLWRQMNISESRLLVSCLLAQWVAPFWKFLPSPSSQKVYYDYEETHRMPSNGAEKITNYAENKLDYEEKFQQFRARD